jgi:hypothetical protein
MLHALFDSIRRAIDQQTCARIPDSRPSQQREERGTHFIGDARQIKAWATRLSRWQTHCMYSSCFAVPNPTDNYPNHSKQNSIHRSELAIGLASSFFRISVEPDDPPARPEHVPLRNHPIESLSE